MLCVVCQNEKAPNVPYRCPQCRSPYCSVLCYKQHKLNCSPSVATDDPGRQEREATKLGMAESDDAFQLVFNNPRIQELLKFEGVSKYLRLVADILHDPKVSGEHTAEGRRIVALKKLRELRKGGREENEAIEELAVTVVTLVDPIGEDRKSEDA